MTVRSLHNATCLIIAALASGSQNGCEIVARVRDMSDGRTQLRAGTLYAVLDRLRAEDLVRVDRHELVDGRPRRYYRLSSAGWGRRVDPARPAQRADLRVGDADRDAAVAALGDYFAQGRLTADELHARLDLALAAVTRRDIWRATQDLPWQHPCQEGGGDDGLADHPARQDAEAS